MKDFKQHCLKLPPELLAKVEKYSEANYQNKSTFIRSAIVHYIRHLDAQAASKGEENGDSES